MGGLGGSFYSPLPWGTLRWVTGAVMSDKALDGQEQLSICTVPGKTGPVTKVLKHEALSVNG